MSVPRLARLRLRSARDDARHLTTSPGRRRSQVPTLQGVSNHLRRFRLEASEAPGKVAELLALPPSARVARLDVDPYFSTLALAEALSERTEPLAEIAPERAALALAVVRRLEPHRYSPSLIADARARALLAVSEAAALGGETDRAGLALVQAEAAAERGSGDIHLSGALAECLALVRWASGSATEALLALEEAERAYRESAEGERLGCVKLRRGFLHAAVGDDEAAAEAFESVLAGSTVSPSSPLGAAAHWALAQLLGLSEEAAS